jgi:D-alanyl-D-alanine carboxypeptidase
MLSNKAKSARVIWRFSILVVLWIICRVIAAPVMDAPREPTASAAVRNNAPSPFLAVSRTPIPFQRLPTRTPTRLPTPHPHLTVSPFLLPAANLQLDFCAERKPADSDLLVAVTTAYGLSSTYEPGDLVHLDRSLPYSVVYDPAIQVRAVMLKPLVDMVHAMQAAGLHPIIYSVFRDYAEQAAARKRWEQQDAERASSISALPGYSEHQLGLAIDFGSPELPGLVGDPGVQFHVAFARTGEGVWLSNHAREYGFSMSYPRSALETTGFEYEPWHYRYVGVDLATYLWNTGQFLTKFLLDSRTVVPCVP